MPCPHRDLSPERAAEAPGLAAAQPAPHSPPAGRALLRCPAISRGLLLPVLLVAAPAFAEGGKPGDAWGPAVFGALMALPALLLVLAALAPAFVKRVQRALATEIWSSLGWGALGTVLVALVAGILSQGGQAGRAAGGCVGVAGLLLGLAGWAGWAKAIGDWALARWNMASLGPVSVLLGGILWTWLVAVPVVGWAVGLVMLIASLGAAAQVLLNPKAFDEPAEPPVG